MKEKKLFAKIFIVIPFLIALTGCSKTTDIENYLNTGTEIDSHAKEICPLLILYLNMRTSSIDI